MILTSRGADLFLGQNGAEQRKLLRLVLQNAAWKGGELRMSLRAPFEDLRLSNSGSDRNKKELSPEKSNLDNWRRGGDSNPR